MCIYVYIYIYIHVYIYTYIYIHTYTHNYVYIYTHLYICVYIYIEREIYTILMHITAYLHITTTYNNLPLLPFARLSLRVSPHLALTL